ncbi:hypothetical protein AZE42_09999 [Rhizopogon vesiculosus]|uniref:F-box domain-containing protein n=1 Tax=Rhizopogon vesiculosus TaxID=180088 RepID=A0A1J8PWL6_9AGAM|nr:hypothetical protein AZE42_09999 [Rhizopogon vesiculosus]
MRRIGRHPDVTDDLSALLYYAVPSLLLPNLRHLTWAPGASLNLLRHLLSPHLLSLKIPNSHWVPESSLFVLTKIPGLCPRIKSLTLQLHCLEPGELINPRDTAQYCISRVICCWRNLEELDCNPPTTESVRSLSVLSSLRILRLQVTNQSVVNLPPDSLSFPSLHTLQLQVDTLETAIAMMKAIEGLPKSLKIVMSMGNYRRVRCSRENAAALLLLVGDALYCELRNFSITFPVLLGDDPVNICDLLQPLFNCKELRTLCIRMSSQFTLGDDELHMMATAWPWLEELELLDLRPPSRRVVIPQPPPPAPAAGPVQAPQLQPPQPAVHMNPHPLPVPPAQVNHTQHMPVFPPPVPAAFTMMLANHSISVRSRTAEITFRGLISLLDVCPNLHYFDLAIDATKLDDLQGQNPGGGVCNRLVKTARLIDSPVGDPDVVARILLDILPELDDFIGSNGLPLYPPHNITPQGWLAVRQKMINLRQARAQQLRSRSNCTS